MLITLIFLVYAALFGFLYRYTQSWALRKRLAAPQAAKPVSFLANVLIPAGGPWFLLVLACVYWGFTKPPEYFLKMQLPQSADMSVLLLITVFVALGLSYVVVFYAGSFDGYRDGRYNAIGHFPHYVREGSDGKAFEIRGYVDFRHDLSTGSRLFYDGRLYEVTDIDDLGECAFVTAQYGQQIGRGEHDPGVAG
jgi:hypothetical protein